MQRKPIANKYRKGTMKSTLHSTYATQLRFGNFALRIQAPKGVKERVKSPYSITSAHSNTCCCAVSVYINVYAPTYTHAGIIYFYRLSHTRTAHVWNEYVFIQRSTIGQSVFASFMMVAGCYVFFFTLHVLL